MRTSRSISDWLRRDRLTNIALKLLRSIASLPASRTASEWTWSNARATWPISSADSTSIGATARLMDGSWASLSSRTRSGSSHRGDVERAFPQPAQRPDQGPGHGDRREQHQEQDDRGQDGGDQRGLFRAPLQRLGSRDDVPGYAQLDLLHGVDLGRLGRVPRPGRRGRADVQGARVDVRDCRCPRRRSRCSGPGSPRSRSHVVHEVVVGALLGRRGGGVERGQVGELFGLGGESGPAARRRRRSAG